MGMLALSVSLDLLTSRAVDAANAQAVVVTNTPLPVQAAVTSMPPVTIDSLPAITLASGTSIAVTNPLDTPLLTRDVDNPARHPMSFAGVETFAPGDTTILVDMGTVPADQTFVAEFLTVRAQLPATQRVYGLLFADTQHAFAPTLVGNDAGQEIHVLSQPVRVYFPETTPVRASVIRFDGGGPTGSGSVTISLAGHFVKPI